MAKVLRAVGLEIGHEAHGKDGAVGGIIWNGVEDLSEYDQIWLQVRHPLKVIASSTTCRKSSFHRTAERIGVKIETEDSLLLAMESWVAYDNWARRWATFTYQIENLKNVWPVICKMLNLPYRSLPEVPTDTNRRKHRDYTWDDLWRKHKRLTALIYTKATEHGYS